MSYKSILTSFSLLMSFFVFGQPMRKSNSKADSTSFKIQANYLSNYTYNGRADSIMAPYFYTTATVNFPSGIYTSFSLNYLLTPGQSRYDYAELDLGYNYSLSEKITGDIYGSKYFYSTNSNLINGNVTSDIGFTFNYDLTYLNFHNAFDIFFTNKADMQLVPGIEKDILLSTSNDNKLIITPGVYGSFSTLNFYESSINRRLNGIKNSKVKPLPTAGTIISNTTVDQKGLKFLDMEFSLPISYDFNNWNISLVPTYAIPFNKITTTSQNTITLNGVSNTATVNSTPYSENHLANIFFFDLGITYKF